MPTSGARCAEAIDNITRQQIGNIGFRKAKDTNGTGQDRPRVKLGKGQ